MHWNSPPDTQGRGEAGVPGVRGAAAEVFRAEDGLDPLGRCQECSAGSARGAGGPRARLGPQRGGDDRAGPEGAASRTDKRPIPGAPCSRGAEADSGLPGRTLRVMLCT